jgi:uncharacterized protein (DUF1697 family)
MKYAVLLRGINVGGNNKVVMSELRELVRQLGYEQVETYINSGNLFFDSSEDYQQIHDNISQLFAKHYPFVRSFSLFNKADYEADLANLPTWWDENLARKDVLFYTDQVDQADAQRRIEALPLGDEVVHFGQLGVYWGKYEEKEYLKTAYHKHLLKEPFYKLVTIRNGKTFVKLGDYLTDETHVNES